MRARLPMLALVLAATGGACSKDQAPAAPDAAIECASRAECTAKGAGLVCSATGQCVGCASDGQCELRERCDSQKARCVFKPGWGASCAKNDECQAGQLCVQGLCVAEKDATLCVQGTCLAAGQRCNRGNGVCEEDVGCLRDADCAESELCNVPTNACVERCTAETKAEVCEAGQLCLENRCTDCGTDADCPGGMVCDKGRLGCVVDGSRRCLSDRDCAAGFTCDRAAGFCTSKVPPCLSNDDCLAGERCDLASGKCLVRACQPDRYEPNGSATEARGLTAGDFAGMTLCDGEQDWYSVKLTRGDRLDVFVDADPLLHDRFHSRIVDGQGRILAEGGLAVERTVSEDGTYFLRFESDDAFVVYGLRLAIARGTPCDDDRFEPNQTFAAAASLHAQGDYDKLTVCGRDQDWFRLDVPAEKGVRVELHYVPSEGAADLAVWTSDGVKLLAKNDATGPVESVVVPASEIADGQVLVQVASLDDRAHAEYFLRVVYE